MSGPTLTTGASRPRRRHRFHSRGHARSGINPYVELHNASDTNLVADHDNGPDGDAFISHYTIPTSGSYYVRVGTMILGQLRVAVDLARGSSLRRTGTTATTPSPGRTSSP